MLRLTLVNGVGKGEATAIISGAAVFTHVQELQGFLEQSLAGCDHLTIDVNRVGALDATFRALICSLHRHSLLVQKQITLQGVISRREDPIDYSGCHWKETDGCCRLWDSMMPGASAAEPGKSR